MILLLPVTSALALDESQTQTDRSIEAQRNYDLAVSYIKSDLYEDGLKTLNQVAFLYPDSDVADDALYQLALIREQVGDGKIDIGEKRSIDTVNEELARLEQSDLGRTGGGGGKLIDLYSIARGLRVQGAYMKGQRVIEEHKLQAITQYVLALDYLNTLTQRYPDSDRIKDTQDTVDRIIKKINAMNPKPQQTTKEPFKNNKEGCLIITTVVLVVTLLLIVDTFYKK
jgi:hypothetical protein